MTRYILILLLIFPFFLFSQTFEEVYVEDPFFKQVSDGSTFEHVERVLYAKGSKLDGEGRPMESPDGKILMGYAFSNLTFMDCIIQPIYFFDNDSCVRIFLMPKSYESFECFKSLLNEKSFVAGEKKWIDKSTGKDVYVDILDSTTLYFMIYK